MRLGPVKIVIRILPVIVLVASGCTHQLDVSYAADPSRQSPLRTISSLTVILEVEDVRPKDESEVVGALVASLGFESDRYQTKKEVQTILVEALLNELENNGHKVIPVAGREADVRIVVRIRKFWIDMQRYLGTIGADCAILNPRDGSIYGQRPVIGTFLSKPPVFTSIRTHGERVLNGALAGFIRSFSRDPELLEYLRLAQEEKRGK